MRDAFRYFVWCLGVTVWVTVCFVLPDFLDSPVDGWRNVLQIMAYIGACGLGAFFWVYFMGCSRWLCAVMLPLFGIIGSALAFYRIGYHTTLTPMLIDVTLHTNAEEAAGVITWQMIVWVILNLSVVALFVWRRWKGIYLPYAWVHCIIAIALGVGYFSFNTRLHKSLSKRFPNNVPYNVYIYISRQRAIQAEREVPQYDIIESPDSLTVVLVLGEAVRADHIQMNGYERETTPRLAARSNIVSYSDIYSQETHTVASLPYILSRADSIHETYQYTETSFVSIFRAAGFKTAWISNQDMGSTFTPFIGECDTVVFANAGKTDNVFSPWLDGDLLSVMSQMQQSGWPKKLYIFHSIGSHWYYNSHVPDTMYYFQPVTTNRVATGNSIEQIVNSYDNTIRYMDWFVDSIITSLEQERAIVFYQSDHGEALGEDGEYLHANDVEVAKHPACIIWYSNAFAEAYPEKIEALNANKDKHYRTDYVFYSILTAAGIHAEGDSPDMNIFRIKPI